MLIQEPVQAAIWQCLNHYDYADSVFLAERLYAEAPMDVCTFIGSDEALFTLATCYYRSGKPLRTYMLLQGKGCPDTQCKLLYAQACFDCKKYSEVESTLTGSSLRTSLNIEEIITEFGDLSCFTLRLLAQVYTLTEQTTKAVECYQRCLKLNSFLWSAFESLCHIGERPDPHSVFQVSSAGLSFLCQSVSVTPGSASALDLSANQSSTYTTASSNMNSSIHELIAPLTRPPLGGSRQQTPHFLEPQQTPSDSPANLDEVSFLAGASNKPRGPVAGLRGPGHFPSCGMLDFSPLTPSFGILPLDLTPTPGNNNNNTSSIKNASRVSVQNVGGVTTVTSSASQHSTTVNHPKPLFSQTSNTNTNTLSSTSPQASFPGNVGLRRSSRLFGNRASSSSSVKENNKNENRGAAINTRIAGGTRKTKAKLSYTPQQLNEKNKAEVTSGVAGGVGGGGEGVKSAGGANSVVQLQRQSANGLMLLLQDLGKAYVALSRFDCKTAVELFNALPPQHFNTGWVLSQVGRAYFEMSNYHKAEKVYNEILERERYRTEGLEVFSTVLWHLQHDVQLSRLSQHLTSIDKHSPEAWCATGNCFSLQKEHDVAIRYFQRAIQVDPSFAYAYTLLGHEYVLIEELDKALSAFRNAVRLNPRHYNAWYGVGMVCFKQEKFQLAEVHFSKALSVNPTSCALLCHLGVAQHAQRKSELALQTLSRAIEIDARNPLCKFHRASVLFSIDRHEEALRELEDLKELVPKESLVYFLMGKVHKKLGNTDQALVNFSWAMDLDPKGTNNHIKEAIDRRYMNTEDDEASFVMSADGAMLTRNGAGNDGDVLAGTGSAADFVVDASAPSSVDFINTDYFQLRALESDDSL